mmetsp:Transcript_87315/g.282700  ORF Transcript_87315/g.282700 Transcript_87315/m.282700 type:complete len:347 (+) Transcript_87315:73-1113(+)
MSYSVLTKDEEIRLSIQLLSGAEVAVVSAKSGETVRAVKQKIEAAEGTCIKQQQLLFGHSTLRNRQRIAQAGLSDGTTLQLVRLGPEEPPLLAASGKVEVLEEDLDERFMPTEDEVDEFAEWLGMDPDADANLLWIAEAGLKAPLPSNWRPCRTADGEIFYFNFRTGESVWDHPSDEHYRELFKMHKQKQSAPFPPEEPRQRWTAPLYRHRIRHGDRRGNQPKADDQRGEHLGAEQRAECRLQQKAPKAKKRGCRSEEGNFCSFRRAEGGAAEEVAWALPKLILAESPNGLYGPQAWRQLMKAVEGEAALVDTEGEHLQRTPSCPESSSAWPPSSPPSERSSLSLP